MPNYMYEMNDDETRLTVRTVLNPEVARMHWPATADVSRRACLLVRRPVKCEVLETDDETPMHRIWSESPEWRAANARTMAAFDALHMQLDQRS